MIVMYMIVGFCWVRERNPTPPSPPKIKLYILEKKKSTFIRIYLNPINLQCPPIPPPLFSISPFSFDSPPPPPFSGQSRPCHNPTGSRYGTVVSPVSCARRPDFAGSPVGSGHRGCAAIGGSPRLRPVGRGGGTRGFWSWCWWWNGRSTRRSDGGIARPLSCRG